MLKTGESVKKTEREVATALQRVLTEIPFASVRDMTLNVDLGGVEADGLADVMIDRKHHKLILEVKSSGQPRMVRSAIEHLRRAKALLPSGSIGVVGVPYLSDAARDICVEAGVGYIDLVGNCRIVAPGVFIDRRTDDKPKAAQREQKSVFAPKSAQILRTLLRKPDEAWKVTELADAAGVSLGQVSNVRKALIDREWAEADPDGLRLTDRAAMLRAWRESYVPPPAERQTYYTTLHGKALDDALVKALRTANDIGRALAMSFTAADYLAPYARVSTTYLASDPAGLSALIEGLRLKPVMSGANVEVLIPDDDQFFANAREPRPGLFVTSALQSYLDLGAACAVSKRLTSCLKSSTNGEARAAIRPRISPAQLHRGAPDPSRDRPDPRQLSGQVRGDRRRGVPRLASRRSPHRAARLQGAGP